MDAALIGEINREAIYVLIATSGPILIISLAIGVIISLFQALTQIQEATLTFVPKILIIYLSLVFLGPYITSKLEIFTDHMMQHITHQ
ncbi:MAG: flagellar biosynthesis protein FliQ [Rickettsiaceae bacterium]|nr:flagellar biosynthesis protein FliQ [Rickettsiaceae bacterium]